MSLESFFAPLCVSTMQAAGILSAMTATSTPSSERLHESSHGFDRIDREAGIIRGVRVLGLDSKNGRRYLREAVQSAKRLYEGARVYLDHKVKGERSTKERWGKLVNVREDSDGGLIADLSYLTKHAETEAILEAAEKFLDIGLSHDTLGRSRMEGGERVIYEIVKVNSVDLVENPATTENLWESEMPKLTKKNLLAVLRENRAKVPTADRTLKRIAEMSDSEPSLMKEMDLDGMEVEVEEEMSGDEAVKSALRQAILAVLDGPDDSATTMKKIKMLMDAGDRVATKPPVNTPESEEGDEVTKESTDKTGDEKLDALLETIVSRVDAKLGAIDKVLERVSDSEKRIEAQQAESACRSLLESQGREVTDERLRLLAGVPVGDREALVESWPKHQPRPGQSRPRYSSSESGGVSSYQEARKNVRALQTK